MTTHNATTAAEKTTSTTAEKKSFFGNLFPKKEKKVYDPCQIPDGSIINGPMADHFRAMMGIGRAYDPTNFDKKVKAALTEGAKPEVKEGPRASKSEQEAIVKAIKKTQPEPVDTKPVAQAIVEGLSAAVEENANSNQQTSKEDQ